MNQQVFKLPASNSIIPLNYNNIIDGINSSNVYYLENKPNNCKTQPLMISNLETENTIHKDSVQAIIRRTIQDSLNDTNNDSNQLGKEDDAFLVADLGEIIRQFDLWKSLLPRIHPFYALKCNNDDTVVRLLAMMGCGFDCASRQEIEQIINLGVDPSLIVYANPCKQVSYLHFAANNNVKRMTFDSDGELYKIKKHYPSAELILRIKADNSKSVHTKMSEKFGAPLDNVKALLKIALKLELKVVGVSFHVGSGCNSVEPFRDAVERARYVFDQAADLGIEMTLLDVGGGFYSAEVKEGDVTFEKVAAVLGPAVDQHFPENVQVISEPGRFFVSSAFTSCVNVIGTKNALPEKLVYYLNEGTFGSLSVVYSDIRVMVPKVLSIDGEFLCDQDLKEKYRYHESLLWGPTCHPHDLVSSSFLLPKLRVGDWLYFESVGAYSITCATEFNGFTKSRIIYTNTYEGDC